MIHAAAIDDEPLALEVLTRHAMRADFLQLDKTFTNAAEGMDYVLKYQPDVLFLDIRMPDRNGLDLAELLPRNLQVIFTTAYARHAVKGFELNATDYLLKPISLTRFIQACHKVKDQLQYVKESCEIFVKENGVWHKVLPEQVLYIEANGNYLKLVTNSRNYLLRQTLSDLQQQLPGYFARIHKSYIINTRHIDRVEAQQVTIGFSNLAVSGHYKKNLFSKLGLV